MLSTFIQKFPQTQQKDGYSEMFLFFTKQIISWDWNSDCCMHQILYCLNYFKNLFIVCDFSSFEIIFNDAVERVDSIDFDFYLGIYFIL